MKYLCKFAALIFLAGFFVSFVSCSTDESKPEDFKTLDDAQTALDESQDEVFISLEELSSVANVAATFDGTYPGDFVLFKTNRSKALSKKQSPHSFGYNSQTGYWTFDSTASDQGLTYSLSGRIKFTPHDFAGLPDETTNTMEYKVMASLNETVGEEFIDLSYDADMNVSGIAGFRAQTGNATINGSNKVSFSLDLTLDTDHIVANYDHAYKANNVVIDPTSTYPQSGTFDFTIKRDYNIADYGVNFYIQGTITFDGTNIAVLEFGGYTFHINLDGPYIVEFIQA